MNAAGHSAAGRARKSIQRHHSKTDKDKTDKTDEQMHAERISNSRWDVRMTARHRGQKPEPWIGPGAVPDHRAEGRTGKSYHPRQAVRAQPLSGGQCAAAPQTPTNAADRWPGAATLDCSDIAKLREIVATFPTTRELVNSGDLKAVLDVRWRRVRAMQNLGRRRCRAATVFYQRTF